MGGAKLHFLLEATWQILVRAVLVRARWHVQVMAVSNSATTSRSDVWKYISKDSSSASATCTLCEKVLAYRGGTSNLWDHLLRSYPREYHHKDKQQSTLNSIVKKCSDARAKVISELLIDLVALDVRPVRFVVQKFEVRFLLKANVRMGKSPIRPTTSNYHIPLFHILWFIVFPQLRIICRSLEHTVTC